MKQAHAIFLLSLVSLTLHAQSLEPGIWKAKTTFKISEFSLPPSEEEECISSNEAKDARTTIEKELKKNGCKLLAWKVVGSNLEASLTCKNDELDAKGKLHGHFTKKSYELSGDAQGTYQNMLPATATMKLTGEWIRVCAKK